MGMQLRSIAITGALSAVVIGMVVGHEAKAIRPAATASAAPAAEMRFTPALVIAKRPSISEILDLILGDGGGQGPMSRASATSGALPEASEEAKIAAILRERTSDSERANRVAAA